MAFGKIKDAWPVWALVVAGMIVIILAVNQKKVEKEAVALRDIFPEDGLSSDGAKPGALAIADPVQSPAIVASSEVGPQVSYAVQLYSFKEQSRADKVVNDLKAQGLPAYIQMSDLGAKGTWYRVRIGSYTTADAAKELLAKISEEHKGSIIVKDKK